MNERMEEYKAHLKSQGESFKKEKAETLEWIAKAEAELKMPIKIASAKSGET